MFKPVSSQPDFVRIEHRILEWWYKSGVVKKYLHKNDKARKRFSFLDGPITANNPMGVHHAWGRTLKDLYQRYKQMCGFKERFQNGFDNQGLWVEVEVEKKLGFKSKKDIEKCGIAKFVEECKKHTLSFAKVQTEQSKRLGYFMDWGNDYYTMSDENNYMIWYFLKKVWKDGNLYKGRDSVPWCPRCGTAISQHEILTEEYQELTHDSVFLLYPIISKGDFVSKSFLVWTTTPWTIPGNVALAVNPEITYVEIKTKGRSEFLVLAKSRLSVIGEPYRVVQEFKGSELKGFRYEGPFDNLERVRSARKENPQTFHTIVLSKNLVSEEEGTGIVHIAPGAGTEDFRLGKEVGLPVIDLIDELANYHEGFGEFSSQNAKKHPALILHFLKEYEKGRFLYRTESFTHRYPVCWRCKTELVWRVVNEWYIAMDDKRRPGAQNYRKRLKEIIRDVRWIPSFGYDHELDWLKNMEDWLISKKRYWGLALPIWECSCGNFEVIDSREELKKRAVEGWEQFEGHTPHRPWVDRVKIGCPKCSKSMSRISDVGNPWLDAGIVSFSTLIDPKTGRVSYTTDKKYWKKWFPADLVLECFPGQFKNWFYSLLAMSVVLEKAAPFKTLLGHALVRDEHGEEMHKSKGNAIEFTEAAEKMGADVMRWMYVCQNPTLNLNFGYGPAEETKRRFFLILWNCYKFFTTYAELDGFDPACDLKLKKGEKKFTFESFEHNVLDIWVLSKLNELVKDVTLCLENYENHLATRAIEEFVVDDLSTWYVRRIRDRVGPAASNGEDKKVAHTTLYSVLLILSKLLAPLTPFLAEEIYQNLVGPQKKYKGRKSAVQGAEGSVHLTDWPPYHDDLIDQRVLEEMVKVRRICELGHAERKRLKIKVRQPLKKLKVQNSRLCRGFDLRPTESPSADGVGGQAKLKITTKSLKLFRELEELIKDELNVKEVEWVEGVGELAAELDLRLTPKLKAEGEARELVREIQSLRKKKNCKLNEKIVITAPSWPKDFEDYIKQKTLALKIKKGKRLKIE